MEQTHRLWVAIVDDDSAVLDSLRFLLEVAGCRVLAYTSAMDYLKNEDWRPDCLILDHHMPQMTGLELAARLREAGDKIPILLITGSLSPLIVARAAEFGVQRVLEKPPPQEELLSFVFSHC